MNPINDSILEKANEAAVYTVYIYLAHKTTPADHTSLRSIVTDLEADFKKQKRSDWTDREIYRLRILKNAVSRYTSLAHSRIRDLVVSRSGLTACTFTNQSGHIFVVFRGTGKGEWIDNGEGLSGVPEQNIYKTYAENGIEFSFKTIEKDYATDQQAEALNWFNRIAAKNGWASHTRVTLCGHSKGGNKAQFIAIHTDLADACFSFDGQGFSPEAVAAFKRQYGRNFETRRQKIYSLSADNDYINVLGTRLMPKEQIYYFESRLGFHYLEAMLDTNGQLNPQCPQGELSRYVETVSQKLMRLSPSVRKYATLGVMNVFQTFIGEGAPVNGDSVSVEQTIIGMGLAIDLLLQQSRQTDGDSADSASSGR